VRARVHANVFRVQRRCNGVTMINTVLLAQRQRQCCKQSSYDNAIDAIEMSTLTFVDYVLDSVESRFTHDSQSDASALVMFSPPPLSLSLFLFLSLYLSIYLSVYFPLLLNTGYLRFSTSMCIFIVARFYYPLPIDYTLIKILSYGLAQKYKSSRNQILFH